MQDQWWQDKAAEVQHYTDTHNVKKFFSSLKTVFCHSASGSAPLRGKHSSRTRRVSTSTGGSTSALCWIGPPQLTQTPWIRSPNSQYECLLAKPPTIEEIKKAIHQTISGRALGKDGIPTEIYKAAGPDALGIIHDILLTVWEEEMMPDDYCDALIVSLYKKKGSWTAGTTGVFPSSQL